MVDSEYENLSEIEIACYLLKNRKGENVKKIVNDLNREVENNNFDKKAVNRFIEKAELKVSKRLKPLYDIHKEHELRERFELDDARVVSGAPKNDHLNKLLIGHGAARYLENRIAPETFFGVSLGTTLRATIDLFDPTHKPGLLTVPLLGNPPLTQELKMPESIEVDQEEIKKNVNKVKAKVEVKESQKDYFMYNISPSKLSRELAQKLNGVWLDLSIPNLLPNIDKPEVKYLKYLRRVIRAVDITLVGIGSLGEGSTMLEAGFIDQETLPQLSEKKVVGDIAGRFFKNNGEPLQPDEMPESMSESRVFGIELEDLEEIDTIAVAGNPKKAKAIKTAMEAGYIDILVTDSFTAQEILDKGEAI